MTGLLVDSDILIEFLRGNTEVRDLLTERLRVGRLFYSVITEAEILAGVRPGEAEAVDALLFKLEALPVTRAIAQSAGALKNKYGKSHGLLLPDALIAATAIAHGLTLLTRNVKHFGFKEVHTFH